MTTTRVDFYQLSRDPVDVTVAKLARKVLQAGERWSSAELTSA